jgi:hypothetical protein
MVWRWRIEHVSTFSIVLLALVCLSQALDSCTLNPDTCTLLAGRLLFRWVTGCDTADDCSSLLEEQRAALLPTDAEAVFSLANSTSLYNFTAVFKGSVGYFCDPSIGPASDGAQCDYNTRVNIDALIQARDSVPGDPNALSTEIAGLAARCGQFEQICFGYERLAIVSATTRRWYSWRRWRDFLLRADSVCVNSNCVLTISNELAILNVSLADATVISLSPSSAFFSPGFRTSVSYLTDRLCVETADPAAMCLDRMVATVVAHPTTTATVLDGMWDNVTTSAFEVAWSLLETNLLRSCGWNVSCYQEVDAATSSSMLFQNVEMVANVSVDDLLQAGHATPSCWINCDLKRQRQQVWAEVSHDGVALNSHILTVCNSKAEKSNGPVIWYATLLSHTYVCLDAREFSRQRDAG